MNQINMTKSNYIKWSVESGRGNPKTYILEKYVFLPEPEDNSRFDANEKDATEFWGEISI